MKLQTFTHSKKQGWSVKPFPQVDCKQTLVLVFGAACYRDAHSEIGELVRAYPNSHVVGCSTSGEIFDTSLSDDTLSVAVVAFDGTALRSAMASVGSAADSYAAGQSVAKELLDKDLRGVLVLSDGLNVNGSELINGLNAILPESVVVTGGLAGDGDRFQATWVISGGRPQSNFVTAVGFYGDRVQIGHGSKGGWDIFGPERLITKSENNVLYELDGKPALDLYKSYLGDRASELPASGLLFPLAIRSNAGDGKHVVRTLLAIDEAKNSMTFAGDIQQGHFAQLMKANLDRLIDGASKAAVMANENSDPSAGQTLSVAISCVGRRLVLGERAEDELESTLDVLPRGTQQVGFYSYGEISPFATGHCDLHNQTMTLTTIREASDCHAQSA
jgi:hypothetical protein